MSQPRIIESVLIEAQTPTMNGDVYTLECLQKMAMNNPRMFMRDNKLMIHLQLDADAVGGSAEQEDSSVRACFNCLQHFRGDKQGSVVVTHYFCSEDCEATYRNRERHARLMERHNGSTTQTGKSGSQEGRDYA